MFEPAGTHGLPPPAPRARRRRRVPGRSALTWGTGVFGSMTGSGFEDPGQRVGAAHGADRGHGRPRRRRRRGALPRRRRTGRRPGLPGRGRGATSPACRTGWSPVDDRPGRPGPSRSQRSGRRATAGRRTPSLQLVGAGRRRADGRLRGSCSRALRDAPAGLDVRLGGSEPRSPATSPPRSARTSRAPSSCRCRSCSCCSWSSSAAWPRPACRWPSAAWRSSARSRMLRLLTLVTDVSVFSINIVTMLGLGLAIDYALFVVSRFREERRRARRHAPRARWPARWRPRGAPSRSPASPSRSRWPRCCSSRRSSCARWASAAWPRSWSRWSARSPCCRRCSPCSATGSTRCGCPVPRRGCRRGTGDGAGGEHGAWYRLAHSVMRRPVVYVAVIVPLLLVAGLPFLRVAFGGVDHRALPAGTESRVVVRGAASTDFPRRRHHAIDAVVTFRRRRRSTAPRCTAYVERLGALPGVTAADGDRRAPAAPRVVAVRYEHEGIGAEARELVDEVRARAGAGRRRGAGRAAGRPSCATCWPASARRCRGWALFVVGVDAGAAVPRLRLGGAAGQGGA